MPRLLDLLAAEGVPATFFCTGDVARKHPEIVRRLVAEGHELGCHGDTHARFGALDRPAAERELADAGATLRAFGCAGDLVPRAQPRLPGRVRAAAGGARLPARLVAGAAQAGLVLRARRPLVDGVERVPATIAPSAVRLPWPIRNALLARMRDPVVLFFHPWEFVDVTREPIPLDCRFQTGEPALASLRRDHRLVQAARGELPPDARALAPRQSTSSVNTAGSTTSAASTNSLTPMTTGASVAVERNRDRVIQCHTNDEQRRTRAGEARAAPSAKGNSGKRYQLCRNA